MWKWILPGLAVIAILSVVTAKLYDWTVYKDALERSSEINDAIVIGNLSGALTVTEFVDYRCPFCPILNRRLMSAIDDDVTVIVRPLPWISDESGLLAVFMAHLQKRDAASARKLHTALMEQDKPPSYEEMLALAAEMGIDTSDAASAQTNVDNVNSVKSNFIMAHKLKLRTVPTLVIGGKLYSPASEAEMPSVEQLRVLIDKERQKK